MTPTLTQVFAAGLLPVLFTGLGVLPFIFIRDMNHRFMGLANAMAAGLMLGASLGLLLEGGKHNSNFALLGLMMGVGLVGYVHRKLNRYDNLTFQDVAAGDAAKMLLILSVMTAHSFAEGIGVGMSYGGGSRFGAMIALAIAVHKFPEGLAISLVLVPRGTPVWKAALWCMFTSLPLPLMSTLAFGAVLLFAPLLPLGLGLAAGGMTTMVFVELLPEALTSIPRRMAYVAMFMAVLAMIFFQFFIGL